MSTSQSCTCACDSAPRNSGGPSGHSFLANTKIRLLLAALAIVLPIEILSLRSVRLPSYIELPLFLVLITWFGKDVFRSALRSIRRLDFSNINLLMTIAIVGAFSIHEWDEAVIIVVLFSLGEALESYGKERSRSALETLVRNSPKSARLADRAQPAPVESVPIGSIVIVSSGDQIPLDGDVVQGSSLIDEAAITGEPLPRSKSVGDPVYAGTFCVDGHLGIRVTKASADTTLATIIHLTYESAEKKAAAQRFIEKFSWYYTPAVMLGAALLVVIPVFALGKPFTPWFTQALTLLVISCPCALVISTPVAVFSAIGNATQRGVVIKGGEFIEAMGTVKAIALDKTRTLTKGEPAVSDVVAFNDYTKEDVLACAAGMEALSKHPVARSITAKAAELNLDAHPFENFQSIMGKGLKGDCLVCTDKHHCLGNRQFVGEEHWMADEILKKVDEFESQGKTTIVLSTTGRIKGVIGVTDAVRPESKGVIEALQGLGVQPVMLTGDNRSSARYVARALGIERVEAELLPEQKVRSLAALREEYGDVAMVGDGVNDAAALASASVGIAMGAISSDIALESADIALMVVNLNLLPFLVRLGRACRRTIRVNITAAVLVKALFIALALLGRSNLAFAVFADVGVTVLVILHSLRLYRYA